MSVKPKFLKADFVKAEPRKARSLKSKSLKANSVKVEPGMFRSLKVESPSMLSQVRPGLEGRVCEG